MKRIRFKIIYVPLFLMLVIGALMIGLTDYLTAQFTADTITQSTWWSNIVCTNVGIACMITAIILIRVDNFKEENEDYCNAKNYITKYYNDTKYQTALFKLFCADENLEIKKETYRIKINKKFTKLKPKPKDLYIQSYGTKEEKANNKYCKKYEYYNTLMSKEYVDKNIGKMHIKHNTISEALVFSGTPTVSDKLDYVIKHKAFKIIKDVSPKYLLTFSITVLIATMAIDLKDGITWALIFKTSIKLFSICSQIYYSYNYSNRYNREVTMHDINFRTSIIKKYDLWLLRKVEEVK